MRGRRLRAFYLQYASKHLRSIPTVALSRPTWRLVSELCTMPLHCFLIARSGIAAKLINRQASNSGT